MRDRKTITVRDRLRGKPLAAYDALHRAGPVEGEGLFELLSGREGASPAEMRDYIGRHLTRLNRELRARGQQVRRIGTSTYILARRAGRGDAELRDRIARLETLVTGGIVPGSPTSHRVRRMFGAVCAIPAQTVDGAVARERLRDIPEFQFPLDQARLQRAAVRDAAVFW
jgi:hypothetical protein